MRDDVRKYLSENATGCRNDFFDGVAETATDLAETIAEHNRLAAARYEGGSE